MTQTDSKDPRTYALIGAAMEVHRILGPGFLEAAYQEAFALELADSAVPFRRELELPVRYKDQVLKTSYRADFFAFESVIVELKALQRISALEEAQAINYLKATGCEVALLLNFGAKQLEFRRFVLSSAKSASSAV